MSGATARCTLEEAVSLGTLIQGSPPPTAHASELGVRATGLNRFREGTRNEMDNSGNSNGNGRRSPRSRIRFRLHARRRSHAVHSMRPRRSTTPSRSRMRQRKGLEFLSHGDQQKSLVRFVRNSLCEFRNKSNSVRNSNCTDPTMPREVHLRRHLGRAKAFWNDQCALKTTGPVELMHNAQDPHVTFGRVWSAGQMVPEDVFPVRLCRQSHRMFEARYDCQRTEFRNLIHFTDFLFDHRANLAVPGPVSVAAGL